jgi:hypothetical protein
LDIFLISRELLQAAEVQYIPSVHNIIATRQITKTRTRKMPFSFKLPNKFTTTKWNDQGKRPRADTVQVDEVVASFTAMNKEKQNMGGEKRSQDHLFMMETPEEVCCPIGIDANPEHEQRDMVQNIAARVLAMQQPDAFVLEDDEIPGSTGTTTTKASFIGSRIPAISFVKYVERLVHNINRWAHEKPGMDSVGAQSGVFAIEYLERSCADITPRSIHRYFLAAFLIGIKYSFDYYLSNTYWAGVGGIRLQELNTLEMDFCGQLNWDFTVAPEVFQSQFEKTRLFYI